jgi:Leu/Phe-tRNA-protein transferase
MTYSNAVYLYFLVAYNTDSQMKTTLTQALGHSRLPDREFLAYLAGLQEKLTKELANNL